MPFALFLRVVHERGAVVQEHAVVEEDRLAGLHRERQLHVVAGRDLLEVVERGALVVGQRLPELRRRLEKSNYETEPLDLTRPDADRGLARCRLLAIFGPEQPYAADATTRVVAYVRGGGNASLKPTD